MKSLLLSFLILLTLNTRAADENTCAAYSDSTAKILLPAEDKTTFEGDLDANESLNGIYQKLFLRNSTVTLPRGIMYFAIPYAEFLCSQIAKDQQKSCNLTAARLIDRSLKCAATGMTVKSIRPLGTSFMRNAEFQDFILPVAMGQSDQSESYAIRKRILEQFQVLIVAGGQKNPIGIAKNFNIQELRLIEQAYIQLRTAVKNRVGVNRVSEFSHIWGAGGMLARIGKKTVKGQFGEVYSNFILQTNVVVDVVTEGFSANGLAERIAHESGHSQDYIAGYAVAGKDSFWSETAQAQIFAKCGVRAKYGASLMGCYKNTPTWFNFHPTNYSAKNSTEFYGKMLDEWVRENLGLVAMGRYRCQSKETSAYWDEMEANLIGEKVSSSCP